MLIVSPKFGSLSFASTLMVTTVSSLVIAASFTATGGLFTALIVTLTVAVLVRPALS
jgi:hypothetical protein